jgi:hypothetical protein
MKIDEQIWKKCVECGQTFLGKATDQTCPACSHRVKESRAKKLLKELANGNVDEFGKVLSLYGFVPSHKKTVTSRWYQNSLGHQVKVMFDENWSHYSKGGEVIFAGEGVEALRIYLEKTYGEEEKKSFWKEVSQ